jgi:AhpD family alkylhydroperoxidase
MRFDPYAKGGQWYHDVLALSKDLRSGPLEATIAQLIDVRVSQINGCSFCLAMHTTLARHAGVTDTKLDLVAGWPDAAVFDARERAALGLAEAMTRIGDGRTVDDDTWQAAREQFNDDELAALLYTVGLINIWNRINVAVELPHDHSLPG